MVVKIIIQRRRWLGVCRVMLAREIDRIGAFVASSCTVGRIREYHLVGGGRGERGGRCGLIHQTSTATATGAKRRSSATLKIRLAILMLNHLGQQTAWCLDNQMLLWFGLRKMVAEILGKSKKKNLFFIFFVVVRDERRQVTKNQKPINTLSFHPYCLPSPKTSSFFFQVNLFLPPLSLEIKSFALFPSSSLLLLRFSSNNKHKS